MNCSSCGAQVSPTSNFCASCGKPVDPDTVITLDGGEFSTDEETITPETPAADKQLFSPPSPRSPRITPSSNPTTSTDPIGGGRFAPGQIIAQRYRIVALAGRGVADTMPITTPLNAWYAEGGVIAVGAILLFALYGFQVSRAGKPLFGRSLLDN